MKETNQTNQDTLNQLTKAMDWISTYILKEKFVDRVAGK